MLFQDILKYFAVLGTAFCGTYLLIPLLIKWSPHLALMDRPGERRVHQTPVPRAGGIAIFVGFHVACALVFFSPLAAELRGILKRDWWLAYLGVSLLLLTLGIVDDVIQLRWFPKLVGQIAVASLMYGLGVQIDAVHGVNLPEWLDFVLTVGWFLFIANAFNLIDGMDGLAAGLALIAAVGLAGVAILTRSPSTTLVLFALMGSCVAFLRFNFHPARIFLGDAGSLFLGFTLAAISLESGSRSSILAAIGVPLLAVGVPIFDTMLAVWRRSARALNGDTAGGLAQVMQPDMEHLHHRLIRRGWSQRRVALVMYAGNFLLVGVGLLGLVFSSQAVGIFLIAFVVGVYVVVRHIARVELWDSGVAIVRGLRRPRGPVLFSLLYPIADAASLLFAAVFAHYIVADSQAINQKDLIFRSVPIWVGVTFISLVIFGVYGRVWSRARISDFVLVAAAFFSGTVVAFGLWVVIQGGWQSQDIMYFSVFSLISGLQILSLRAFPRTVQDLVSVASLRGRKNREAKRVIIYGAGRRGLLYLRQRLGGEDGQVKIVGFIDDDLNLRKRWVYGFQVLGALTELDRILMRYESSNEGVQQIVVGTSIPAKRLEMLREIAARYRIALSEWSCEERPIEVRKQRHVA